MTALTATSPEIAPIVKKWKDKKGSLIQALHELQNRFGYVPRDGALAMAKGLGVPLARIYEVITFYNYFKLEAPGKFIVSVCTGTACHIKGSGTLLTDLEKQLGVKEGASTADKEFHLQGVRCLGCCGLAPLVSVNGKVYGKLAPTDGSAVLVKIKVDKPMVAAAE